MSAGSPATRTRASSCSIATASSDCAAEQTVSRSPPRSTKCRYAAFSATSLAWVVNAYLLTFGGFLLLGGRLGDLFGHRRMFLAGITLFTLASAACGLAGSQGFLIAARAVQGLGGAVASAVSLSLMMNLFTTPADRAKAMGVFGFVASGGGSIGVLLGGILTGTINWHWIFLVNVPIGIAVVIL